MNDAQTCPDVVSMEFHFVGTDFSLSLMPL